MLANLDRVLKHSKRQHAIDGAGQVDLFGATKESELKLEELPEFSFHELLWNERKATGAFLSGHPIDIFRPKFQHKITHRMRELDDLPSSNWPAAQPVILCGLVEEVKERGHVAVIRLSDETGRGYVTFYRDDYDRCRFALFLNNIVALSGKLSRDDRYPGVKGNKAHKVGDFRKPAG